MSLWPWGGSDVTPGMGWNPCMYTTQLHHECCMCHSRCHCYTEAWPRFDQPSRDKACMWWTTSSVPAASGMSRNLGEVQLLSGWGDWQDPPMWLRPGLGRTRARRAGSKASGGNLEVRIRSCLPLWAPSTCVQWYLDTCSGDALAFCDEPERGAGDEGIGQADVAADEVAADSPEEAEN